MHLWQKRVFCCASYWASDGQYLPCVRARVIVLCAHQVLSPLVLAPESSCRCCNYKSSVFEQCFSRSAFWSHAQLTAYPESYWHGISCILFVQQWNKILCAATGKAELRLCGLLFCNVQEGRYVSFLRGATPYVNVIHNFISKSFQLLFM